MKLWAIIMLVSGGLFSGGVTVFAWERVPAWRSMPLSQFMGDFAVAIRKADRVQPALLLVTIVVTVGLASPRPKWPERSLSSVPRGSWLR
jgi:hypothetical protein